MRCVNRENMPQYCTSCKLMEKLILMSSVIMLRKRHISRWNMLYNKHRHMDKKGGKYIPVHSWYATMEVFMSLEYSVAHQKAMWNVLRNFLKRVDLMMST